MAFISAPSNPSPKTIQLYYMDGVSNGRVKCTLTNWTGVTYLIPRTEIAKSTDRLELEQTGVYFLFGEDEHTGVENVYVGQASIRRNGNGVLGRIREHIANPESDYWTHAVILITSNNSFGPTEISYLEHAFHGMAVEAGRMKVINSVVPSEGNVTEEKMAELDEFISYAEFTLSALGYKVFEPVDDSKDDSNASSEEPLLYFSYSDSYGKGRQTSDGFVVLKGSKIRTDTVTSFPDSARRQRVKHADTIDENGYLTADVLLRSPSGAAAFLGGASINGNDAWKTEDGTALGSLEKQEIQ